MHVPRSLPPRSAPLTSLSATRHRSRSRPAGADLGEIADAGTVPGILIALGVPAASVGLIRSEIARDLRTLTATGASSATRRPITAATAAHADLPEHPAHLLAKNKPGQQGQQGVAHQPKPASRISRNRVPDQPEPDCRGSAGTQKRVRRQGLEPRTRGLREGSCGAPSALLHRRSRLVHGKHQAHTVLTAFVPRSVPLRDAWRHPQTATRSDGLAC